MRKITRNSLNSPQEWKPPTLRITRSAAIYARRSDERAKSKVTDTSQSREMQTEDVLVVAVSPYTMIYDFADEFLTEMFRWKCKEAGEFIKRQVKGWMLPARFRAAKQGCWSGLGDVSIGYVVDIDPKSPTYKRFIVYEPHAVLVVYLFNRFAELAGDLSKLMRELEENRLVFPQIPEELSHSIYLKSRMMQISGGQLRTRTALVSIL